MSTTEHIPGGHEVEIPHRIIHVPIDDFNETLLLHVSLKSRGYPVDIQIVSNSHPSIKLDPDDKYADEFMFWEVEYYERWAEITVDPSMKLFTEGTPYPGDAFRSDDPEIMKLIRGHPIQLLWDIDVPQLSMQIAKYQQYLDDDQTRFGMKHQNENYPWNDLLQRIIVTTGDRWYQLTTLGKPLDYEPDEGSYDFYMRLKESGVRALNPEELAGIIGDYYSLIERHFPEFLALRNGPANYT